MKNNISGIITSMALGGLVAIVAEGIAGRFFLSSIFRRGKQTTAERQANEYFPVQSPSEVAAGHPLVGAS